LVIILMLFWSGYVFIGTYVFPIAPHWVTQLPPNPPSPKIKHGEFTFELKYCISGEEKIIKDKLLCDFEGFEVVAVGGPKTRKYSKRYENKNNYEIFQFKNKSSVDSKIVLENIGKYKVFLDVASAEYFLGDPEYHMSSEMPYIQLYDTSTGYYIYPEQCQELLEEYNFIIVSWCCDYPVKNIFK